MIGDWRITVVEMAKLVTQAKTHANGQTFLMFSRETLLG